MEEEKDKKKIEDSINRLLGEVEQIEQSEEDKELKNIDQIDNDEIKQNNKNNHLDIKPEEQIKTEEEIIKPTKEEIQESEIADIFSDHTRYDINDLKIDTGNLKYKSIESDDFYDRSKKRRNEEQIKELTPKQKKKKAMLIFAVFFVIAIVISLGTYSFIQLKDKQNKEKEIKNQENILKNEMASIVNSNLLIDSVNMEIKSKGDYAYIEEKIKNYYGDIADNLKILSDLVEDKEFKDLSTLDNIKNDDKELSYSFTILNKTKTQYNDSIDKLKQLCIKDKISNLLDTKKTNKYYNSLYEELMLSDEDIDKINEYQDYVDDMDTHASNLLIKTEELLSFLKDENGKWSIENNEFKSSSEFISLKYKQLIDIINEEIEKTNLLNIENGYSKKINYNGD